MSDRSKIAAVSNNIVFVPLNKLKKSPKNVRQVPHAKADIQALSASIAAIGMLQYPVVEPELGPKGKPTGCYLVNAGEGRRLAQLLRAKRKEIRADAPMPCVLDTEHSATEISLAENAIRTDMHPADQYEAFAKLHGEEGMSAEDIAARFGVTAAVVRQHLKLGAVSPKLRDLYRKGDLNLDQLSAFAITEDHERQERVWSELPPFNRSRDAILRALSEGQVRSDDRRARFVGAKAYEQAGGTVIRDLFDSKGGGFFADAELLNRLARQKLQSHAETVAKEGWRWVVAELEFDHEACADMRRVFAKPVPLSKAERQRLRKLDARYKALFDKYADGEMPPEVGARMERIEAAVEALQKGAYTQRDLALAGAFVTLAGDGSVRIERGFVRAEDEPKSKGKAEDEKAERHAKDADGLAPLSEKLVAELTAYRTSALRSELARHLATALIALVHALALAILHSHFRWYFFMENQCITVVYSPQRQLALRRRPAVAHARGRDRAGLPPGSAQRSGVSMNELVPVRLEKAVAKSRRSLVIPAWSPAPATMPCAASSSFFAAVIRNRNTCEASTGRPRSSIRATGITAYLEAGGTLENGSDGRARASSTAALAMKSRSMKSSGLL